MAVFKPNDFNTSCHECSSCDLCMECCLCSHCQVSYQYNMLTVGRREMNMLMLLGMLAVDCCGGAGLFLALGNMCVRMEARNRLGLTNEDAVKTLFLGYCCFPCSMCQVYREMSMRNVWPGGIFVKTPYQNPHLAAPLAPAMNQAGTLSYSSQLQYAGHPLHQPPPQNGSYAYAQPQYGVPVYQAPSPLLMYPMPPPGVQPQGPYHVQLQQPRGGMQPMQPPPPGMTMSYQPPPPGMTMSYQPHGAAPMGQQPNAPVGYNVNGAAPQHPPNGDKSIY